MGIWLGLGLGRLVESVVVGTWLGLVGSFLLMGLPVRISVAQLQRDVPRAIFGHGFGQQQLQQQFVGQRVAFG